MKTEHFKKVFIDGKEENLPKGEYWCHFKVGVKAMTLVKSVNITDKEFDWYLLPVPDNRELIIEKQRELIKAWEDTSVMAGASKYLRMLERISILESELSSLQNDDEAREQGAPFDEECFNPDDDKIELGEPDRVNLRDDLVELLTDYTNYLNKQTPNTFFEPKGTINEYLNSRTSVTMHDLQNDDEAREERK